MTFWKSALASLIFFIFSSVELLAGEPGTTSAPSAPSDSPPLRGVVWTSNDNEVEARFRFRLQNLVSYERRLQAGQSLEEVRAEVRRLRLRVDGHLYRPHFQYRIQLSFSRNDQDWDNSGVPNVVRDASIIYVPNSHWDFSFGQSKLPGNLQRIVSSGEMQFIDRSIVNRTFNLDRDFGIQGRYSSGKSTTEALWRLRTAVTSGKGRNAPAGDAGFATTTRGEWLPGGEFKEGRDLSEGDLRHEERPKFALAGGYHASRGATRSDGTIGRSIAPDSADLEVFFADAVVKYRGYSLYSEWMKRNASRRQTALLPVAPPTYTGSGLLLQAGKVFGEDYEGVARYARVTPRNQAETAFTQITHLTLGANRYLRGHRFKLQFDVTREERKGVIAGSSSRSMLGRVQVELGI